MKDSSSSRAVEGGSVKPQLSGEQDLRERIARIVNETVLIAVSADRIVTEDGYATADAILALTADPWRPIETAPRDGTHVLLAFGSDHVAEGWWEDADPGAWPWKFVDRGCPGSEFAAGEMLNGSREVRGGPTHWLPLPAPLSSEAPPLGSSERSEAEDHHPGIRSEATDPTLNTQEGE